MTDENQQTGKRANPFGPQNRVLDLSTFRESEDGVSYYWAEAENEIQFRNGDGIFVFSMQKNGQDGAALYLVPDDRKPAAKAAATASSTASAGAPIKALPDPENLWLFSPLHLKMTKRKLDKNNRWREPQAYFQRGIRSSNPPFPPGTGYFIKFVPGAEKRENNVVAQLFVQLPPGHSYDAYTPLDDRSFASQTPSSPTALLDALGSPEDQARPVVMPKEEPTDASGMDMPGTAETAGEAPKATTAGAAEPTPTATKDVVPAQVPADGQTEGTGTAPATQLETTGVKVIAAAEDSSAGVVPTHLADGNPVHDQPAEPSTAEVRTAGAAPAGTATADPVPAPTDGSPDVIDDDEPTI